MKKIKLTQNKWAIVDDKDYELVSRHTWHAVKRVSTRSYAAKGTIDGKSVFMHRYIMKAPKGLVVDHINHDTLDNRRKNLRVCTQAQNIYNSRRRYNNRCGYKGITFLAGKYVVQLKKDRKWIYGGRYVDPVKAAKIYDKMAKELFGEFACLNFP